MARYWTGPDSKGRYGRILRGSVEAMVWFSHLNKHWVFHLCCPRRGLTIGYAASLRSAKLQATRGAKSTGRLLWTKLKADRVRA